MSDFFILNENKISKLLWFETLFVLLYNFLVQYLHFPSGITYICDLINIIVLLFIIISNKKHEIIKVLHLKPLIYSVFLFFLVCIISAVINLVKPQLAVWAIRNNFRFYIYLFAIMFFLNEKHYLKLEKSIFIIYHVNFLLSLYQFFFLGYKGDYLGGIFGTGHANAFTTAFLCLIICLIIQKYLNGQASIRYLLYIVLTSIIIAAMAELKFYFILVAIIVFVLILRNKLSLKSILLLVALYFGLTYGMKLIISYFPQWASRFESIYTLLSVGNDIGGGYNLSRFGGIATIQKGIFNNDGMKILIGNGFGSAEYSSFPIFTSSFFNRYGYLNYRWFTHLMMYIECGYCGILSFILVFITAIYTLLRLLKKSNKIILTYANYGMSISIVILILFFYNSTLRQEAGYILFFGLGVSFMNIRKELSKMNRKR